MPPVTGVPSLDDAKLCELYDRLYPDVDGDRGGYTPGEPLADLKRATCDEIDRRGRRAFEAYAKSAQPPSLHALPGPQFALLLYGARRDRWEDEALRAEKIQRLAQEAIARAKAEIVDGLKSGGTAVLNADDPLVIRMRERRSDISILSFGIDAEADVKAGEITSGDDLSGGGGWINRDRVDGRDGAGDAPLARGHKAAVGGRSRRLAGLDLDGPGVLTPVSQRARVGQ